jgi:hypothetical protein
MTTISREVAEALVATGLQAGTTINSDFGPALVTADLNKMGKLVFFISFPEIPERWEIRNGKVIAAPQEAGKPTVQPKAPVAPKPDKGKEVARAIANKALAIPAKKVAPAKATKPTAPVKTTTKTATKPPVPPGSTWVNQKGYGGEVEKLDAALYRNKVICSCGEVRWVKDQDKFQVSACKPCTRRERRKRHRRNKADRKRMEKATAPATATTKKATATAKPMAKAAPAKKTTAKK